MTTSPAPILLFQPASPRLTGRELKADNSIADVAHKRRIAAPPKREGAEFAPFFVRPATPNYVDNFLKAYGLQSKRRIDGGLRANKDHLVGIGVAPQGLTQDAGDYDLTLLQGKRRPFVGMGSGGDGQGAEEALQQGSITRFNILGALGARDDDPANMLAAKATSIIAEARRDRVNALHQGKFQTEKNVREAALKHLSDLAAKGLPDAEEIQKYARGVLQRQPWEERQNLVDFETRLQETVGKESNSVSDAWRKNFKSLQRRELGGEDGRVSTQDFLKKLQEISERRESGGKAALSEAELHRIGQVVDPGGRGVVTFSRFASLLAPGGPTASASTAAGAGAASPEEPSAFTSTAGSSWQDSYRTPVREPRAEDAEPQHLLPSSRRLLFSPSVALSGPLSLSDRRAPRVESGHGAFAETVQSFDDGRASAKKRPGTVRATLRIVASDDEGALSSTYAQRAETARVKEIASGLRRLTQQQGSLRQYFLRQVPHLQDGTTSMKELAHSFNRAGLLGGKVKVQDVANLLALSNGAESGGSAPSSSAGGNLAHQRVGYSQFAQALTAASASVLVPPSRVTTSLPPPLALPTATAGTGIVAVPQTAILASANAAAPHPQLSSLRVLASLTDAEEAPSRLLPAREILEREANAAAAGRISARASTRRTEAEEEGKPGAEPIEDGNDGAMFSPPRAGRGLNLPGSVDEIRNLASTAPEGFAEGRARRDSIKQLFGDDARGALSLFARNAPAAKTPQDSPNGAKRRPQDPEDIKTLLALEKCRRELASRGMTPSRLFVEADQERVGVAVPAKAVIETLQRHGIAGNNREESTRVTKALLSPQRAQGGDDLVSYQEIVAALFPSDDTTLPSGSAPRPKGKKAAGRGTTAATFSPVIDTPAEQLEAAYRERRADHLLQRTMRENLWTKGNDARSVWLRMSDEGEGPANGGSGGALMPRTTFKAKMGELIGKGVVSDEDLEILVDRIQGQSGQGNEVSFTAFARAFRGEDGAVFGGPAAKYRSMRRRSLITSAHDATARRDKGLGMAGPRELEGQEQGKEGEEEGPPFPRPRRALRAVVNPEGAFRPEHDSVAMALQSPPTEMKGRAFAHPPASLLSTHLENRALGETNKATASNPFISSQAVAFSPESTFISREAEQTRQERAFGMTTAQSEARLQRRGKRTTISAGPRLRGAAGVIGERTGPQPLGWLTGTPAFLSVGIEGDASMRGAESIGPFLLGEGREAPAAGVFSPNQARARLEGAHTVTPFGISGGRKRRGGPNHGTAWTEESGKVFDLALQNYPLGPSPQDLAEERLKIKKYGPQVFAPSFASTAVPAGLPSARLGELVSPSAFDVARSSSAASSAIDTHAPLRSYSVPPALRSSMKPTSSVLVGSPPARGFSSASSRRASSSDLFTPQEALGPGHGPKGYRGKKTDFGAASRLIHSSNPFFL